MSASMMTCRFAPLARSLGLTAALLCAPVVARDGIRTFDKREAYCGASAIFVGVATKVYFEERPAMDTCDEPAPRTVAQFAAQGMICHPLYVEVEVKEYLFTTESPPRDRFKLYMKWAAPVFRHDTVAQMGQRLRSSPFVYAVRFIKAYEDDGVSWLLGYPRSIDEHEHLRVAAQMPPCGPP